MEEKQTETEEKKNLRYVEIKSYGKKTQGRRKVPPVALPKFSWEE